MFYTVAEVQKILSVKTETSLSVNRTTALILVNEVAKAFSFIKNAINISYFIY